MTGPDLTTARATLGHRWGYGRPLMMVELGHILRLKGRDVGATIRDWERGHTPISGPASVAVDLLLAGGVPPDGRG